MEKMELLFKMSANKRREMIKLQRKLERMRSNGNCMTLKNDINLLRQQYYLKRVISENNRILMENLLKDVKDPLVFALKQEMYKKLFRDVFFLRLLVSESVTNRLTKACNCEVIPNWLIEKIEMCALVILMYDKNN